MSKSSIDFQQLALDLKRWALKLGFAKVGITDTNLSLYKQHYENWLKHQFGGEMNYLSEHKDQRFNAKRLVPNTYRIISVSMSYPANPNPHIAQYALGRDYHKVIRKKLQQLADKMTQAIGSFNYRAFVDTAPVLEKGLAEKAGLGWTGKHSILLNQEQGSRFFLGELYTDLPLPTDQPVENQCGKCERCIQACPTRAIVAPYQIDTRRCIEYLTIVHKGIIPVEFRSLIGTRIFGCDACQNVCPFNQSIKTNVSKNTPEFNIRDHLKHVDLIELFHWTEEDFLQKTEGSVIRRIGYERWQRNIAVALGNSPMTEKTISTLKSRLKSSSNIIGEHITWALNCLQK